MNVTEFIDNKFLTGAYLKVEDELGQELSPTYRIDPRMIYKDLGEDMTFEMVVRAKDKIERDRIEVLRGMLVNTAVWVDTADNREDMAQVAGILTMVKPRSKKTTSTIAGDQIHHVTLESEIIDSGKEKATLKLRLTFIDKKMLHGLSFFNNKVLTARQLPAVASLISTNAFGELPVLATYEGKYVKDLVTPYGYGDMLSVSGGVLMVYGYDSKIGVDIEGSHTTIKITDSGYTMDVELKDHTHLYIYL